VLEGVALEDRLVLNPSDSINDGDVVAIAPPVKQAAAAATKGGPKAEKAAQ